MTPLQITRSVRSLNRLRQIAQVLTRHGFGHIVAQADLTRFAPVWMVRKKRRPTPLDEGASAIGRRLTTVCTELGPTFIKLGQLMSTRPDILPEEIVHELSRLQDKVPPFDTEAAMGLIARELGRPVEECFRHIEKPPLASASIGQVYRATTRDGRDVVIKVRRPDLEDTIRLDMHLLRWLATTLEEFMPELRVYRPVMLVAELEEMLTRELDYINEASSTARFSEAFKDDPGIRIPAVFWEYTAPRVLTIETIPGRKVTSFLEKGGEGDVMEKAEINRPLLARRLADSYLKQIFELGMFHADPHPGNLFIDPPSTLGIIDFGQVGTLSDDLKSELITLTYAAVNQEIDIMIDTLADMGAMGRDCDRRVLHRALQVMLDKYYGLPIKRLDPGTLLTEFASVMRRNDVIMPRDMAMLIKALSTVGSLTARLDPNLSLLELLKPRLRDALGERFSARNASRRATLLGWDVIGLMRKAPRQIRDTLRRLSSHGWELHVRHENIDRLIRELDRSSNRLAFSVVIAAIIVGSSVVISSSPELTVLGFRVQYFGIIGYLLAGVLGLGLSWAIFRSGRLH